jgi:hypothetical protein
LQGRKMIDDQLQWVIWVYDYDDREGKGRGEDD